MVYVFFFLLKSTVLFCLPNRAINFLKIATYSPDYDTSLNWQTCISPHFVLSMY